MDTLPSDILRLLPQWLDVDAYLSLSLTSKRYRKLFYPKTVHAIIERWISLDVIRITICLTGKAVSSSTIPDEVFEAADSYKNDGYIVRREELLSDMERYEMQIPMSDFLDKYMEITDWGTGHIYSIYSSEWNGWRVAKNEDLCLIAWPNEGFASSCILEVQLGVIHTSF